MVECVSDCVWGGAVVKCEIVEWVSDCERAPHAVNVARKGGYVKLSVECVIDSLYVIVGVTDKKPTN